MWWICTELLSMDWKLSVSLTNGPSGTQQTSQQQQEHQQQRQEQQPDPAGKASSVY